MQKTALLSRPDGLTWAFLGLGVLLLPLGLYLALAAPPDANQGYLVRIMYLHVPTAWVGYLAFFVTFLYSLLYLFRQDPRHDRVADEDRAALFEQLVHGFTSPPGGARPTER